MGLRTLSLSVLLSLVLAHTETVSGLIDVMKTIASFAAGTVPGLVQLTPDNMNPSIDCSVVLLHILTGTMVLNGSRLELVLHGMRERKGLKLIR